MEDNICERGINKHFFPIVDTRWFKHEGKVAKKVGNKTVFVAEENSRWDLNCFKFMDFLSTYIKAEWDDECNEEYNDIIMDPYTDIIYNLPLYKIENINEMGKRSFNPFTVYTRSYTIPLKLISKSVNCKGFNKEQIFNILEKISNCRIKTHYEIYSEGHTITDGRRRATWKNTFSNMSEVDHFQSLFDYEIIEGNVGKNGKVYNYKIKIDFRSQIGAAFIHNVFSTGYCRINESLYKLSRNAQILYRKRYLPYTSVVRRVVLNREKVFDMLGLNINNYTVAIKTFKLITEELADNNLIKITGKVKNGSIKTSKIFD